MQGSTQAGFSFVRVKGGDEEVASDAGGRWQVAVRWSWSAGDHPRLMKGVDSLAVWHVFNSWQTVGFSAKKEGVCGKRGEIEVGRLGPSEHTSEIGVAAVCFF